MKKNRQKKSDSPKTEKINIWHDIAGAVLILGVPMLYFMLLKDQTSGIVGKELNAVLKCLFGKGAYIFPICLLYYGLYLIIGKNNQSAKQGYIFDFFAKKSLIGIIIIFFSVTSLLSINNVREQTLPADGGYIGYAISFVFTKLFGDLVYYFFSVIIIVSLIMFFGFSYKVYKEKKAQEYNEEQIKETYPDKTQPKQENIKETKEKEHKTPLLELLNKEQNKPGLSDTEKTKNKNEEFTFNKIKKNLDFKLPPASLLNPPQQKKEKDNSENIKNIQTIENTLNTFNIEAEVLNVSDGPTVSRYEIKLAEGIRVQKIISLADNLAMSLAAIDVRVEAPIPGKSAIGVEVPKSVPTMVTLREIIEDPAFQKAKGSLTFAIGKDVAEKAIFADLTKMPHLLIGGATNSGKSVGLNTLIASLLYRMTPDELRFVMIDPKRVELSLYDGIPHLACPVIKDSKLAAGALKSIEQEMDKRYITLEKAGSRNIESYNSKVDENEKLPYMVIVIDELADLMMQCAKDVESSICRIAQLARAVGIHLVIATQRPSVDVITGKIKANIASRIAFAVSSHHDSRTILDASGAERLIGRGDMLFAPINENKPLRVQGCFLSEKEINNLVDYLKEQKTPEYDFDPVAIESSSDSNTVTNADDDLWNEVVSFCVRNGYCSTSMLQRHFKIGYNRAGSLVDMMEAQGIVGPLNGAKPRTVLITESELENILNR